MSGECIAGASALFLCVSHFGELLKDGSSSEKNYNFLIYVKQHLFFHCHFHGKHVGM
jgi:hypothetical protein